jgi:hypothetical protein
MLGELKQINPKNYLQDLLLSVKAVVEKPKLGLQLLYEKRHRLRIRCLERVKIDVGFTG